MTSNAILQTGAWLLPVLLAVIAGISDWHTRRIPNWLTVSGLFAGIALNTAINRWPGAKSALLGAVLGLAVLLPFVALKSLGAGDWKLVGALGAFFGPERLLTVLFASIFVAGIMALLLVIYKGRFWQTIRNIGRMSASLFTLHRPAPDLTLDNPQALKIPFGVAVSIAVLLYTAGRWWGVA